MPKRKYTSRGPKCPVCKAVMHPGKDGEPVCSFKDNHATIRTQKLRLAAEQANKKR